MTRVPVAGHLVARDAPAELARIVSAHAAMWLGADDVGPGAGRGWPVPLTSVWQ